MKKSWYKTEKHIEKEVEWLRNSLDFHKTPRQELKQLPRQYGFCSNCILRKIALLISAGNIKAKKITKEEPNTRFWINNKSDNKVHHGGKWHRHKMEQIENHFKKQNCEIVREPPLRWGRADLGIYKNKEKDLFVEVGSISPLKLFVNLKNFNSNMIYLIVPNNKKLVEFSITDK